MSSNPPADVRLFKALKEIIPDLPDTMVEMRLTLRAHEQPLANITMEVWAGGAPGEAEAAPVVENGAVKTTRQLFKLVPVQEGETF